MKIRQLELEGVLELKPEKHHDERGFFSETFNSKAFAELGPEIQFVQDNHSYSVDPGVLRGLHFQRPPFAQDKLVRVTKGRVFDVAVDIRRGSPTFGRWAGLELSADAWNQIFVPAGFAHGFLTLEPDCEVAYKVSSLYNSNAEVCIRFDDPNIGISWPMDLDGIKLSDKDAHAPRLENVDTGFVYENDSKVSL